MDDEYRAPNPELRKLFPRLSEEELREVEDTFHGYLEIAWRIYARLEAEGYFKNEDEEIAAQ
jgi:hypothetical protein